MNKELLNVVIEFKETEKLKECPIKKEDILWDYFSDSVILGRFSTPDFKYISTRTFNNFEFGKNWVSIECTPILYNDKGQQLDELNIDEYIQHEDFWRVMLNFEYPDDLRIQSTNIIPLKYGNEIWCIFTKQDQDYYENIASPHIVNIVTQLDGTNLIDCDEDCSIISEILDYYDDDE